MNEDGEWEEYVEEVEADKPPIAYTYMGSEACPIEDDSECVDFCMQYRIPKIEVQDLLTNTNHFITIFTSDINLLEDVLNCSTTLSGGIEKFSFE